MFNEKVRQLSFYSIHSFSHSLTHLFMSFFSLFLVTFSLFFHTVKIYSKMLSIEMKSSYSTCSIPSSSIHKWIFFGLAQSVLVKKKKRKMLIDWKVFKCFSTNWRERARKKKKLYSFFSFAQAISKDLFILLWISFSGWNVISINVLVSNCAQSDLPFIWIERKIMLR